jgi:NAD(P)H-hydrate epimerase
VTLGCAADLLPILAVKLTESTFLPLPTDLGVISERAVEKLRGELKGYKALLVGCGLSTEKETAGFVKGLFTDAQVSKPVERPIGFSFGRSESKEANDAEDEQEPLPPLVIDGDGLNILSEWEDWHEHVPVMSILTPHPGEMARLLKSTVEEVQADRISAARDAAKKWNQVIVLKGAGTLIAGPGGKIYVSPFSNPVLATAGSGDVLAGVITGLLAQGLKPVDAARAGVYLHGLAGEMLREEMGLAGGLAGDLPLLIPRAQRKLREGK